MPASHSAAAGAARLVLARRKLLALAVGKRCGKVVAARGLRHLSSAPAGGVTGGGGGGGGSVVKYVLALLVGGACGYGAKMQMDQIGMNTAKEQVASISADKSSSSDNEEKNEDATTSPSSSENSTVATVDAPLPVASTPEEVLARLYESFRETVLGQQEKELVEFDAEVEVDPASGEAKSVRGRPVPPKSLEEATEIIVLLEALNRGLLARAYEDQTSYHYKQKVFEQLAPLFIGEADRMVKKLQEAMQMKQKKDLDALENEFYKNVVIQLEQQKHNLFTEYQKRIQSIEVNFDAKLNASAANLKAEYDTNLDETVKRFEAYREERMKKMEDFQRTAGALRTMLEHAVEAQKRSQQVWQLSLCLLDVQEAIKKSEEPFASQWEALLDASKGDPILETAITSVPTDVVVTGITTRADLTSRFFNKVESAAREGALIEKAKPLEGGGTPPTIWGYVLARMTSLMLVSQRNLVEGNGPEDIISRAGYHLGHGDLATCTKELEALSGEPARLAQDWIIAAKDRLLLENTLDVIKTRMAHLDVTPLKFENKK